MPDWLTGAAMLLASVASLWAIIQGRRKTAAETNGLVVQSYKVLSGDLQQQNGDLKHQVRMLKEQVRNLEEQVKLLHEQNVHAIAQNALLTAENAALKGQTTINGEA